MMPIRIALGGFPDFVTPAISSDKNVILAATHSVSSMLVMSKTHLAQALDEFSEFHHVVFRLSGENPMEFIYLLKIYGLFSKFCDRKYTASFWTMDSHHLGRVEAKAAGFFDHVFVAHKNYLSLFPQGISHHVPCSFSLAPELEVSLLLSDAGSSRQIEGNKGICAPFAAYPWQKRNSLYLEGLWAAQELVVPYFFGTVRGGANPNQGLIDSLLSFDVVLNFSLSDDLNMRNFEALALNKILLTNRVPDHDLLHDFASNIIFMDPKNQDIKYQLSRALEAKPQDISETFLVKHSIRTRLEEITSILLNATSVELKMNCWGGSEKNPPSGDGPALNPIVQVHTPEVLLAYSGVPRWTQLKKLKTLSCSPVRSLRRVLALWAISMSTHALSRMVRKVSWLRAYLRAVTTIQKAS